MDSEKYTSSRYPCLSISKWASSTTNEIPVLRALSKTGVNSPSSSAYAPANFFPIIPGCFCPVVRAYASLYIVILFSPQNMAAGRMSLIRKVTMRRSVVDQASIEPSSVDNQSNSRKSRKCADSGIFEGKGSKKSRRAKVSVSEILLGLVVTSHASADRKSFPSRNLKATIWASKDSPG